MPPLFKRIFGQGKSKAASNTLVALCIGDYSRITVSIEGNEAHQLQALLAHDVGADEGSPGTSQPAHPCKSSGVATQVSLRTFRHLLQQHFGGGAASGSPQDGAEVDAQQQLAAFLKNLGGYPSVSFLPAAEDGGVSRDKVLAKLTKLFKHSTAAVVMVSYCGPSDERGNWRLASQAPGGGSGASGGAAAAAAGGGAGGGTCVLSFREVSMLWQRYRKHSQRLVLLLDCANSGYWVSALRMLSKAEQLELSLGVQASDCSLPAMQNMQLTYQPGIFIQFYLSNNKWRRDSRRNAAGNSQHKQTQQQHGAGPGGGGGGGGGAGGGTATCGLRVDHWLPGMLPSYYATWLSDNLVDYGLAIRFFNMQLNSLVAGSASNGGTAAATTAAAGDPASLFSVVLTGGGLTGSGQAEPHGNSVFSISPVGAAVMYNRAWRANTGPLGAVDSSKSLNWPSRLVDDPTSPTNDARCSPRSAGAGGGGGAAGPNGSRGPPSERDTQEHGSADRQAMRTSMALRAVSMQDSARHRFSSLYYDNRTTDGTGPVTSATAVAVVVGSHRAMAAPPPVRLSSPQAEFRGSFASPPSFMPGRFPTLPGDESLYRMGQDMDGSGATLSRLGGSNLGSHVISPTPSALGDIAGGSGGGVAAAAAAAGGGGGGSSRLQGRGSGATESRLSLDAPAPPQHSLQQRVMACGVAVHPAAVDLGDHDTMSALGTADESLLVEASAQSDSLAVAWDRRSTHAERCLVEERNGGTTSSFTDAKGGRQGGFAKELFGALHEVVTERRLRARRAPLEGDESLDTMMQDADLERRASVASLPSAMLPRDIVCDLPTGRGGGGGDGGRLDSSSSIGGLEQPSGAAAAPPASSGVYGRGSAGGVPAAALRTSALLGLVTQAASEAGPAAGASGTDGLSSRTQQRMPRQTSRLFMVSVPSRTSGGQLSVEQLEQLAEAGDGAAGDMEELSMTASFDGSEGAGSREEDAVEAEIAAKPQGRGSAWVTAQDHQQQMVGGKARTPFTTPAAAAAATTAAGCRGGGGMYQMALDLLGSRGSSELPESPGAPTSLEWPQPADSPAPTAATPIVPSGRGGGVAGGLPSGPSGALLRNLLRQQVSIADSMDLDSVSIGGQQPMWQRRPGRFEVAGSETSSVLFGDDKERFDALRILRDQDGTEAAEAGPPHELQLAGQAAPRQAWAPAADDRGAAGARNATPDCAAAADAADGLDACARAADEAEAAWKAGSVTQGPDVSYHGDILLSMEYADDSRLTAGRGKE